MQCRKCNKTLTEKHLVREKADMVFTDPPYGIDLDPDRYSNCDGSKNTKRPGLKVNSFKAIENDAKEFSASLIFEVFDSAKDIFIFGANNFVETIPHCSKGSWIVWERSNGESMDKMLGSNFELCWSRDRHKYSMARVPWKGVGGHIKSEDGPSKCHPSQKPVRLAEWFFERWGKDTKLVVDLYLGSGSTLIACEKTNRKCYGCEIDPQYCQVIIDRYIKFSGRNDVFRINADGTKTPFSEL